MSLKKIFAFVSVLFFFIIFIDIKKNSSIHFIDTKINIYKKPYHFITKALYYFDMAYMSDNTKKSMQFLNMAKAFLSSFKNNYVQENITIINKILKTGKMLPQYHRIFSKNIFFLSQDIYKQNLQNIQKLKLLKEKIKSNAISLEILILFLILSTSMVAFLFTQYRQIKEFSYTDHLTNAFNRKKFYEIIEKLPKTMHSIILIDIDYFKKINDTYGHHTGDFVLKEIVSLIQKNIRKDDSVFRWGGEEFLILLKNTNLQTACNIAKKIKSLIEEHNFENLKVTASFGVKECKNTVTQQDLIEVDKALYKAKEKRNSVMSF